MLQPAVDVAEYLGRPAVLPDVPYVVWLELKVPVGLLQRIELTDEVKLVKNLIQSDTSFLDAYRSTVLLSFLINIHLGLLNYPTLWPIPLD